jgi:hypothetical protein
MDELKEITTSSKTKQVILSTSISEALSSIRSQIKSAMDELLVRSSFFLSSCISLTQAQAETIMSSEIMIGQLTYHQVSVVYMLLRFDY